MQVIFQAVDAAEGSVFTHDEVHIGDIVESDGVQYVVPNNSHLPISRITMPDRIASQVLSWLGYQVGPTDWQAPVEDFEAKLSQASAHHLPNNISGRLDRLHAFAQEARRRGAVRVYLA